MTNLSFIINFSFQMEAKKTVGKITKTEIELFIISKVRELRLANKVGQKKLDRKSVV